MKSETIVDTSLGKLCGTKKTTYKNFTYYSFQGIPYAKPPIGNLRFKDTEPPEPWTGIHDATKEGNRSPSFLDDKTVIGDEDCLFLNVYTPELPDDKNVKLKPVMFWIHSGGFYRGSGNTDLYSPDYLISEDVIVVTFNYRLGVFGFLIVGDQSLGVPGNLGIKDMVMALKWVQNNIKSFNGDPNNVTIWGQSAGAISAHFLVVSPAAKGLFHKAIIQSGTSFIGFDPMIRFMHAVPKLVSYAGLETDNEKEAVNYLKTLSTEQIVKAFIKVQEYSDTRYEGVSGPIIENTTSASTIIDQHPELYYMQNRANSVPMIIGSNTMDGMVYASKRNPDGSILTDILNPEVVVPYELNIPRGTPKCLELGKKIIQNYYGKEAPSRRNLDKYSKYQTDIKFNIRIKRIIKLHQNVSSNPIYFYRFGFESPSNLYKKFFGCTDIPGVCHGDELTYLFRTKYSQIFKEGSPEAITHYRMIKMWTNFAKTGNPNPVEYDPLLRVTWLPVQQGQLNHLFIGKILMHKKDEPDYLRMKFWDEFYEKYFKENYEHTYDKEDKKLEIIKQIEILKTDSCNIRSERIM